jgi:transposase
LLGRVDAQGSLLETRHVRRHLVTKGSFYERLADHGEEVVCDEDFAELYAEGKGRPSIPPSVMIRAMLCATHDRTCDAETSRRTRVDSDWKAAMGVDDWFEGIGATTFSLMRARMVAHDADNELFEKTLQRAVEKGIFDQPLTAIIDSSPVHGAGAMADTYELIRKMMGHLARAMGGRLDAWLRAKAIELAAAKPDIDWQDPVQRKAHLGDLVELAATMLGEVAASEEMAGDAEVAEAAGLLSQVVRQDVEAGENGPEIRGGVAPDRVVSHSDPEMRHGRKSASRRFDGHKLDVITDEASELVLGVDVRAGNAGDGEGAAPLLSQVQGVEGIDVDTLLGDMAYSDGEVREAVEAAGADLVAKVPPVTNRGMFPKTDFDIDLAAGRVTCPAGQSATDARPIKDHKGRPAVVFHFASDTCAVCPLRDQCTTGSGGRTVTVGPHHERIEAARAAQNQPETKALLRRRSKVERKIDHLQDLGMRKARYRSRRRTLLQARLAATVANFKRLAVLGAFQGASLAAA